MPELAVVRTKVPYDTYFVMRTDDIRFGTPRYETVGLGSFKRTRGGRGRRLFETESGRRFCVYGDRSAVELELRHGMWMPVDRSA
jgi:hypothetical protein